MHAFGTGYRDLPHEFSLSPLTNSRMPWPSPQSSLMEFWARFHPWCHHSVLDSCLPPLSSCICSVMEVNFGHYGWKVESDLCLFFCHESVSGPEPEPFSPFPRGATRFKPPEPTQSFPTTSARLRQPIVAPLSLLRGHVLELRISPAAYRRSSVIVHPMQAKGRSSHA